MIVVVGAVLTSLTAAVRSFELLGFAARKGKAKVYTKNVVQ